MTVCINLIFSSLVKSITQRHLRKIMIMDLYISPDWPLANAESPVPHPLKNGEVFTMH